MSVYGCCIIYECIYIVFICTQCAYFLSDSGILYFLPHITTKQKEESIVRYGVSNPCINMSPDW